MSAYAQHRLVINVKRRHLTLLVSVQAYNSSATQRERDTYAHVFDTLRKSVPEGCITLCTLRRVYSRYIRLASTLYLLLLRSIVVVWTARQASSKRFFSNSSASTSLCFSLPSTYFNFHLTTFYN